MIDDVKIAKNLLLDKDYSFVAVKRGEIIYTSREKGIIPMYTFSTKYSQLARQASIADQVIGKGAALLCINLNLANVYAKLISESGLDILDLNGIKYGYTDKCTFIKNMDKTDYCPIEKLAMDTTDRQEFLRKLEKFLQKN